MPARNINLLPHKDFDQTPFGRFLRWSLTYGRYIIVCTEIIVLLAFIYRFSLDRKITDLNEEVDQKTAIIEANQIFEKQFRSLQTRTSQIENLFNNEDLLLRVLTHLELITPAGIRFSSLNYSQDRINITASANTNSAFAAFLNNLKHSDLLTKINIAALSKKSVSTGQINFTMEATVKTTEPTNKQ